MLQAIGLRLSRAWSESDLTAIATRSDLLVPLLLPAERTALARGTLRFRVDAPAVIDIAAMLDAPPFWLKDLGFRATGLFLDNTDGRWQIYRRSFPAGWIGLGVNGLDRRPKAHYAVFVRSIAGAGSPAVTLDRAAGPCWKATVAHAGVSPAHDFSSPFTHVPAELAAAVLLQSARSERHSALLATGRVWKTHVVSSATPDQIAVSYGADPRGSWFGPGALRTRSNQASCALRGRRTMRRAMAASSPRFACERSRASRRAFRCPIFSTIRSFGAIAYG